MNQRSKILRHLDEDHTIRIRDPIWKDITFPPIFIKIIESQPFQKLHRIKQLGPTYLIYPGATHTRFSHSLGVFHLAKAVIAQLVKRDAMGFYTLDGVKAFLCAALLHDLGHFPYAHSLKELELKEHERLTAEIIMGDGPLRPLIARGLGVSPESVAAIVDFKSSETDDDEIRSFQQILSGVLDPDKLDYLNRDAAFCGVPYGIQDFEYICSQLEPIGRKGMAIRRRGLPSVESILFSKYLMYRNVYWHRGVRTATAMIKKAVQLALRDQVIRPEDLYGIDDREFHDNLLSHRYPAFRLIRRVSEYRLYRCVIRVPFSGQAHRELEDIERRLTRESALAGMLGLKTEQVIIDVPERISFEMDLTILDREEAVPYNESGSVFSRDSVVEFSHSLRSVSLLIEDKPDSLDKIKSMDIQSLFHA